MTGIAATKEVIDILLADTTVTSKVSIVNSYPAIISGIVLPSEWAVTVKSINIYILTETSNIGFYKIRLSASCRGNTYSESRDIAYAVFDSINRTSITGFSITATVMETQNPDDVDTDNYLTPVEILVRSN